MKRFLQSWVINTLAVLVAVYVVRGIRYQKPLDLIVASLLLGIFNAVLRPFLMFVALPLLIVSLGLFMLVINALLLYFVGDLLRPHFYIDRFSDSFWGALVISAISLVLNLLTGLGRSSIRFEHHKRPPNSGSGGGPVIDI